MPMFTKKPVTIEARQFQSVPEIETGLLDWIGSEKARIEHDGHTATVMVIKTLEGDHTANPGDWIIKGVKGEFYPCKPDIFEMTYTPA